MIAVVQKMNMSIQKMETVTTERDACLLILVDVPN